MQETVRLVLARCQNPRCTKARSETTAWRKYTPSLSGSNRSRRDRTSTGVPDQTRATKRSRENLRKCSTHPTRRGPDARAEPPCRSRYFAFAFFDQPCLRPGASIRTDSYSRRLGQLAMPHCEPRQLSDVRSYRLRRAARSQVRKMEQRTAQILSHEWPQRRTDATRLPGCKCRVRPEYVEASRGWRKWYKASASTG